jgi:hypothetical protein
MFPKAFAASLCPRLGGLIDRIEPHRSRPMGMAKKPEPPKPIIWNVYKIASKAVWLGEVEAPDEAAANSRRFPISLNSGSCRSGPTNPDSVKRHPNRYTRWVTRAGAFPGSAHRHLGKRRRAMTLRRRAFRIGVRQQENNRA